MSFRLNNSQQISLFDQLAFLSDRKLKLLQKSWAQAFSDHVLTKINEQMFAPLYSEKTNSRPNAPINVIVGALILKDFTGLTDDEMLEAVEFDYRYQYALHTTSFAGQPLSDRTFSRFRERCAAYELTTGEDLIHKCFISLSEEMRKFMNISPNMKRMNSMMIESNIRKMGRLELLYICLSNLVKELHRDGRIDLTEGIEHYSEADDRNKVVCYDSETPQSDRLQKVIDDASALLPKCADEYGDTEEYQLLERAINEQTKKDDNGKTIPRGKGDGMNSSSLQNPADPDATCREKAGKAHRGYSANLTEAVDENGSIVTDYQYDVNTRSDSSFISEQINGMDKSDEPQFIIAYGAYSGKEIRKQAADKNIDVITTGLPGRKPGSILLDFKLSGDGRNVTECPAGNVPRAGCYNQQNQTIRISFFRGQCENCAHLKECLIHLKQRTAYTILSVNARKRAQECRDRQSDESLKMADRIRNGVETLPSILRRKYHVDQMPVRRKLKTKQFFGFKVLALNFTKLVRYTKGLEKCRTSAPVNG